MAKYLDDTELYYEIVISKGKGKLTRRAEELFILIATNTIRKKERNYRDDDDRNDCLQQGILHLFSSWQGYNEKKYSSALPYFTEIFKRGMADGYNIIHHKKNTDENIRFISIDSCNEGRGMHNVI